MDIPRLSSEWGLHNLHDWDLGTALNKAERYINAFQIDTSLQGTGRGGGM